MNSQSAEVVGLKNIKSSTAELCPVLGRSPLDATIARNGNFKDAISMSNESINVTFIDKWNCIINDWENRIIDHLFQSKKEITSLELRRLQAERTKLLESLSRQYKELHPNEEDEKKQIEHLNIWDTDAIWKDIDIAITEASNTSWREFPNARSPGSEDNKIEFESRSEKENVYDITENQFLDASILRHQIENTITNELPKSLENTVSTSDYQSQECDENIVLTIDKDEEAVCCKDFHHHLKRIQDIKKSLLLSIADNNSIKAKCFLIKRRITPKIGQLTNSRGQISRVALEIEGLFGKAKEISDLAYTWSLNFFCKAVVKQAEIEVTAAPKSAYPIAMLCSMLSSRHRAIKPMLIGRFVKNCPWVIPCPHHDLETESGKKGIGLKKFRENRWEDTSSYMERQCGIFSVWVALLDLNTRLYCPIYGMEYSWRFLSRIVNRISPDSKENNSKFLGACSCAIIATFFDMIGDSFLNTYGNQSMKLIESVFSDAWLGRSGGGSHFVRLRLIGESFMKTGQFNSIHEFKL